MSDDNTASSATTTTTMELWDELNRLLAETEKDVKKNDIGNVSAGVRVRKALRSVRKVCAAMIKHTTATDKAKVETRKTEKPTKSE